VLPVESVFSRELLGIGSAGGSSGPFGLEQEPHETVHDEAIVGEDGENGCGQTLWR
jgi:hypothetical protein